MLVSGGVQAPSAAAVTMEYTGGDLLVSGGVQAPPDKLRSSYLV